MMAVMAQLNPCLFWSQVLTMVRLWHFFQVPILVVTIFLIKFGTMNIIAENSHWCNSHRESLVTSLDKQNAFYFISHSW